MNRIVLNTDTLDKIRKDEVLSDKIAVALGISPHSMYRLIYANDPKLTQANVLKILRETLGVKQDKHLLAEIQMTPVA